MRLKCLAWMRNEVTKLELESSFDFVTHPAVVGYQMNYNFKNIQIVTQ